MDKSEDHAITALETLRRNGDMPSYAWLKNAFGKTQISNSVYSSLNRGRAILSTVDQLDQYLYTHSSMIASQWEHVSDQLNINSDQGETRIIDYGCGQGLAVLLLHDYIGSDFLKNVRIIVAIEPSLIALKRAVAIYKILAPNALVVPVNKAFNALTANDIIADDGPTIHLFSNVLDIDGYDHVSLLQKGLTRGKHTIIAVGHDRTMHGYSQGLIRVKNAVEAGTICSGITVQASGLEQFLCTDKGKPAVLWLCKLEVK